MGKLSPKQHRFTEEYIKDMNPVKAATRAGYSPKTARYASEWINEKNLQKPTSKFNPDIKAAIDALLQAMRDECLADAYEVEAYLTSVLRGQTSSEIVVIEGTGDGRSKARKMKKAPDERERLKSAEILAKRHGLTDAKLNVNHFIPPAYYGENDLE